MKQHEFQQSVLTMQKSVTITVTPQRSNSLDYLNFEEKRQLIASSLSLSDILSNQVGPVVAQAAKDVAAASSVIGKSGEFPSFSFFQRFSGRPINFTASRIAPIVQTPRNRIISFHFPSVSLLSSARISQPFNFRLSTSCSEKAQRHDSPDDQPQHRHPDASARKKEQIQRPRATLQAVEVAPKKEKRKVRSCVKM